MTKLEELKAVVEDAYDAAWDAADARAAAGAVATYYAAWVAYKAELKKQKENSND
jgi:hypothetical protein